jgi:UV DNA damage endonuclease
MYNLCCISNELKEEGHSFKTMTWKRFNQLVDSEGQQFALNELGERWLNNVEVTRLCIEHCHKNGWGYRVSSSLFPCLTHPEFEYSIEDVPQYEEIMELFRDIVFYNETWQVRLSTHPDQFNVLASENQSAVDKTIKELNLHGWVMDMLGCERSYYNPINIHVNCTKGELSDIAARFMSNLNKCDQSVQSRLVVENEDRGCWTVANLLRYFYKDHLIPITFDNLHDKCNSCVWDLDNTWCATSEEVGLSPMELCAKTWVNVKPLFHYSESHPDKPNPRSHADMPTDYPASDSYDWDIELKSKDAAIRELAMIELVRQSEEMGFYDTQMSIANKVMENIKKKDREVRKGLK